MLEDARRQTATVFIHTALGMGMGMVQSIVAAVLDIVPPLIPPPVWNNMPLPCAPMLTGASLEGGMPNSSVLQMCGDLQATIVSGPCSTLSQWRILPLLTSLMPCWMVCALRVYWSMGSLLLLQPNAGYIAGFPSTYAEKVGKTSDALYKGGPWFCSTSLYNEALAFLAACFSAYMSMHCSSSDRLLFLECCCRVHHGTLVFLGCAFQYSRAAQCRNPEASPCLLEVVCQCACTWRGLQALHGMFIAFLLAASASFLWYCARVQCMPHVFQR